MDQAELELQLKIWKELAISKQVLMRAATDALGLAAECSMEELKAALDTAIKNGANADDRIDRAEDKASARIKQIEEELRASERARKAAVAATEEALQAKLNAEQQMAAARTAVAKDLESAKALAAEKDKALKAINVALADTPKNVIKKLKELRKQKTDEANARKRVESELRALRKQKLELEQQLEEVQAETEAGTTLAERYRELHRIGQDLLARLESAEQGDLPKLPELDEQLLETFARKDEGTKNRKIASVA